MKGWRTILFNVLSGLLFFLAWEPLTQWVEPQFIALAVGGINLVLRFVTTGPVGEKRPDWVRALLVCLLPTALLMSACAHTALGKAVQAASIEKQAVEAVMVALIQAERAGAVSRAEMDRVWTVHRRWAAAQLVVADALATWQAVGAATTAMERYRAAAGQAAILAADLFGLARQWVNVDQIIGAVERRMSEWQPRDRDWRWTWRLPSSSRLARSSGTCWPTPRSMTA